MTKGSEAVCLFVKLRFKLSNQSNALIIEFWPLKYCLQDQWSLIIVGCAAVWYTRDHLTIWVNYFREVNLHPRSMLPFKD